jgi:hypothetical protein
MKGSIMTVATLALKLDMALGEPDVQEWNEGLSEADLAVLHDVGQKQAATYEYGIDGLVHKHQKD